MASQSKGREGRGIVVFILSTNLLFWMWDMTKPYMYVRIHWLSTLRTTVLHALELLEGSHWKHYRRHHFEFCETKTDSQWPSIPRTYINYDHTVCSMDLPDISNAGVLVHHEFELVQEMCSHISGIDLQFLLVKRTASATARDTGSLQYYQWREVRCPMYVYTVRNLPLLNSLGQSDPGIG